MADETATTDTTNSATQATETTDATVTATTADTAGAGDEGGDQSLMGSATTDTTDTGTGDAGEGQAGEGEEGAAGDSETVPEAYTFDLPEGIEIDDVLVAEATPILKELGLSQDKAGKLMPLVGKVQERLLQGQADGHAAMTAEWAKQVKADPEIGGANFKASSVNVARALDWGGCPSVKDADGNETNGFRCLLNDSGIGNHPDLFRMFAKFGAALGEDNDFVRGGASSSAKLPREQVLYPDDKPKK